MVMVPAPIEAPSVVEPGDIADTVERARRRSAVFVAVPPVVADRDQSGRTTGAMSNAYIHSRPYSPVEWILHSARSRSRVPTRQAPLDAQYSRLLLLQDMTDNRLVLDFAAAEDMQAWQRADNSVDSDQPNIRRRYCSRSSASGSGSASPSPVHAPEYVQIPCAEEDKPTAVPQLKEAGKKCPWTPLRPSGVSSSRTRDLRQHRLRTGD